ncbi:MAG: hypothetical protein IKW76_08680 [Clostridia bacterium]|nr:hypothetical protein [Clostridia bacterium]
MNKINHPILIVSTASAMIIIGVSIALGMRYGLATGLLTGLSAFVVLIVCMLCANRWMKKSDEAKRKNKKEKKTK